MCRIKGILFALSFCVWLFALLFLTVSCTGKETIASLCSVSADNRITEICFHSGAKTTEEMEKERIKWSENPAYRYLLPYDEAVYAEGEVFDTYCALFYEKEFHGRTFCDNQISNVYALWRDVEAEDISFQKSEIALVCWMEFNEFERKVLNNEIPHCIVAEEIEMLKQNAIT